MLKTSFNVLRPIANILVWIKNKVHWTRHVVLSFTFAHVVHSAIVFIGVIRNVIVLLFAGNFVGYIKTS